MAYKTKAESDIETIRKRLELQIKERLERHGVINAAGEEEIRAVLTEALTTAEATFGPILDAVVLEQTDDDIRFSFKMQQPQQHVVLARPVWPIPQVIEVAGVKILESRYANGERVRSFFSRNLVVEDFGPEDTWSPELRAVVDEAFPVREPSYKYNEPAPPRGYDYKKSEAMFGRHLARLQKSFYERLAFPNVEDDPDPDFYPDECDCETCRNEREYPLSMDPYAGLAFNEIVNERLPVEPVKLTDDERRRLIALGSDSQTDANPLTMPERSPVDTGRSSYNCAALSCGTCRACLRYKGEL